MAFVLAGDPLVTPMGVAVAGDGTVYVVDHDGFAPDRATVLRIKDAVASALRRTFGPGSRRERRSPPTIACWPYQRWTSTGAPPRCC